MTQTDQLIEAFDAEARRREDRRDFFRNMMGAAAMTAAGAASLSLATAAQAASAPVSFELEVVDAVPRNPAGKILKQALREQFAGAVRQADR